MPKKGSHYLATIEREVQRRVGDARVVHTQMCLDAATIAANEVFSMGESRVEAFTVAFSRALRDIATITAEDTCDMEYTKAKIDGALKRICGKHFVPWEERYEC